jgi:hypothetical protein
MPDPIPDFEREDDLVEWFESADLSDYDLVEALDVEIADKVALTLEEPWEATSTRSVGATGTFTASGNITASIA